MRALWIEDHQLIAASLELLLQVKMPDVSLDMTPDIASARHLVGAFQYEVVLLDWWLGDRDGEHALRDLRACGCDVPIIVVSADDREATARRASSLGVAAYVPKTSPPDQLVEAIRAVVEGRLRRSDAPPVGHVPSTPWFDVESVFPDLTLRQAEVFRHLMRGSSDKQIARDMGVSDTTVKTHVQAILQIVGVHKRGQAVHEARVRGVREPGR